MDSEMTAGTWGAWGPPPLRAASQEVNLRDGCHHVCLRMQDPEPSGFHRVEFAEPVEVAAGESLEVTVAWPRPERWGLRDPAEDYWSGGFPGPRTTVDQAVTVTAVHLST
jgi:hypothetical protein